MRTYVCEPLPNDGGMNHRKCWFRIGSGFVQDWFSPEQIIVGSGLVPTLYRACRGTTDIYMYVTDRVIQNFLCLSILGMRYLCYAVDLWSNLITMKLPFLHIPLLFRTLVSSLINEERQHLTPWQ